MTKALLDANTLIAAFGEGVGPIINESAPRYRAPRIDSSSNPIALVGGTS